MRVRRGRDPLGVDEQPLGAQRIAPTIIMPTIRFEPDSSEVMVTGPETILQASLRAGIPHAHACGGNAHCSTCRVAIVEGLDRCAPRSPRESALTDRLRFPPEVRLACQTEVTGDLVVRRLIFDQDDIEVAWSMASGASPAAAGEEMELAILFADIRGFTAVAEQLPPYDVVYLLNRYFLRVDRIVSGLGGMVDAYMGDGLMALFGLDGAAEASLAAVRAGLSMLADVERLRPHFERLYGFDFQIGVGIDHGSVVVGSIGAAGRRRVTAIGDPVNFASRIESANKDYGTRLLVSQSVLDGIASEVVGGRRIDAVSIRGKRGLHALHEVTALRPHPLSGGHRP